MRKGWEIKKLGEVCEIVNGSTPLRSNNEFWDNGTFPWFTIDDIREQGRIIRFTRQHVTNSALQRLRVLPKNSVLICCTASIGECALTEIPLTTNQQFNGLIVKKEGVLLATYLYHFCSTLKEQLSRLSGKTTIDFIPISRLKEIVIAIPPIIEQQRIVTTFDQAFSAIAKAKANAERNLQNAKELFESYLKSMFENTGEEMDETTLFDVCDLITCGVAATPKYVDENEGIPFLSAQNVRNGEVVLENYKYISQRFHQELTKKNKPAKGDILYSRVGSKFGEAGVVECEFEFSVYVSLTLIKPKPDILNSYYLKHYLNSPIVKSIAIRSISSSGVPNLNVKDVRRFPIRLPSIFKQGKIVSQIEAFSVKTKKLESIYQQKIVDLEELKKSILQKAFSGQLSES
ncbi:MAG: restriction endonuclease subunit S [Bacteroidetes bacterium]|nr:restriction endonuclease subunit S [Bacteroidota bacterium]